MPTTDGVNPALDTYVPLPAGVAVPTNVPPAEHVAGALACGPNTLNVIVEVALLPELDPNAAVIDAAETTVPAVPVPGAETDNVGLAAATSDLVMAALLQRLEAGLLFASAGEDTYHE